jgi:hypothetical protein
MAEAAKTYELPRSLDWCSVHAEGKYYANAWTPIGTFYVRPDGDQFHVIFGSKESRVRFDSPHEAKDAALTFYRSRLASMLTEVKPTPQGA